MAKEAIEIQDGNTVDYVLGADTEVGRVVPLADMIGVATVSGLSGETIALKIVGVYEIAAKTADEIAVGDKLYFDPTDRELTISADDGGNNAYVPAGHAVSPKAGSVAGKVWVKINA